MQNQGQALGDRRHQDILWEREFTAKRAGVRSGKSESSVWDAVEMAELVVNSMVMFSFTHTLQGFWIWIKEAGRFAEGFP